MTDAIAIALIGGTPLTIASIGVLYVQLTTRGKVETIQGHVNSERTQLLGEVSSLRIENALLREIILDKTATAALLAQAVATRAHAVRSTDGPAAVVVVQPGTTPAPAATEPLIIPSTS